MEEESGEPIPVKSNGDTSDVVILIPPLGLEQTARWAEALKAWWKKHGPSIIEAAKDAASMVPPLLIPQPSAPPPSTQPPSTPPPTTPTP